MEAAAPPPDEGNLGAGDALRAEPRQRELMDLRARYARQHLAFAAVAIDKPGRLTLASRCAPGELSWWRYRRSTTLESEPGTSARIWLSSSGRAARASTSCPSGVMCMLAVQ